MPRTKVSKSSKRNRETANREEKVREFENSLDGFQNTLDDKMQDFLSAYESEVKMLLERTPRALLKMKMVDIFSLNLNHLTDWEQQKSKEFNSSLQSSALTKSTRITKPSDEEDSSNGGSIASTATTCAYLRTPNILPHPPVQKHASRSRTPGPLSSARARHPRRSRSACENLPALLGSTLKQKSSQLSAVGVLEHPSRCKIRTPRSTCQKALSADRTQNIDYSPHSPPTLLRFPKPGELVLSKCGSPLVTQMLPENFAHLNIPLRNGIISMRPKKLSDIQPHIIQDIEPVTLDQLRTLKTNIDKLVNMVDKAGI